MDPFARAQMRYDMAQPDDELSDAEIADDQFGLQAEVEAVKHALTEGGIVDRLDPTDDATLALILVDLHGFDAGPDADDVIEEAVIARRLLDWARDVLVDVASSLQDDVRRRALRMLQAERDRYSED